MYTEYTRLVAGTPLASIWSYATRIREPGRAPVAHRDDGSDEYWLEWSDPLLNTVLPGTHVSLIVSAGDAWTLRRSATKSALIPAAAVLGPMLRAQSLHVGRRVRAVGVIIEPGHADEVLGAPMDRLIDRVLPLADLWPRSAARILRDAIADGDLEQAAMSLRDAAVARVEAPPASTIELAARDRIQRDAGRVSVARLAAEAGLSRQQFAKRFRTRMGFGPKAFAKLTRFQRLVHDLLITDVERWPSLAVALGYYDQAHMINEFRALTGASPVAFFHPRGLDGHESRVRPTGRPSQWPRQISGRASEGVSRRRERRTR